MIIQPDIDKWADIILVYKCHRREKELTLYFCTYATTKIRYLVTSQNTLYTNIVETESPCKLFGENIPLYTTKITLHIQAQQKLQARLRG